MFWEFMPDADPTTFEEIKFMYRISDDESVVYYAYEFVDLMCYIGDIEIPFDDWQIDMFAKYGDYRSRATIHPHHSIFPFELTDPFYSAPDFH